MEDRSLAVAYPNMSIRPFSRGFRFAAACMMLLAGPACETTTPGNLGGKPPGASPAPSLFLGEYEVTDGSQGHVTGDSPNPELSMMVRIDNGLFFIYRANHGLLPPRIYVRRFDLATNTFGRAVMVDELTDTAVAGYHSQPSLFRDGSGRLHVLTIYTPQKNLCFNSDGIAPRHRMIGDLSNPAAWSPVGCLRTRETNIWGYPGQRAQIYDFMGVYDALTGVSHIVGEGSGIWQLDGRALRGIPRTYFRIPPSGVPDGPYALTDPVHDEPPEHPPGGNIFTKGDLVVGREPTAPRSLHLVWNIRNTWTDGAGFHQWNYNLYYARSRDGGQTWQPVSGSASVATVDRIPWNDPRFLAVAGDIAQDSERAFDVDTESRPFLVYMRRRAGTGRQYGRYVDAEKEPFPTYDLAWQRWDGSRWVGGTIDTSRNWQFSRPKIRIAQDNAVYVFLGDPPRYLVSRDRGLTWEREVWFGNQSDYGWRLYSYSDPIDFNNHFIAYQNRNTHRLYFSRLRLTNR